MRAVFLRTLVQLLPGTQELFELHLLQIVNYS